MTLQERFDVSVHYKPGCWEWLGSTKSKGYGKIMRDGHNVGAHIVSWELFVGPVPQGKVLDHLCRNRSCVNPNHLEPVTLVENIMRGVGVGVQNQAKTHCAAGHPFDEMNTYRYEGARRKRNCRACNREASRRWRVKR